MPFDTTGLAPRGRVGGCRCWPVELGRAARSSVRVVSMGNPHAVQRVADVDAAPVARRAR